MQKVGLYVRVSTQEQANEGYSIGEQIERLTKYADAMKWKVYKIYTDAGYTGADMNRPALQDMIEDIKDNRLDKIVVYKLDRLSRSQKDTLTIIEDILLKNDTDFVSMNENFDTSTPFGRAMIGILAVFAQLEREQIKERMIMGSDARAKEGKWRGGAFTPIGYDYIDGELKINDYEAMQVKEIFKLFIEGTGIRTIVKILNEKGYKHKNREYSPKAIRYILANKTYLGYLRHRGEWINGIHKTIIDENTFDIANKLLEDRKERYISSGIKADTNAYTTFLGGLLICKHCGGKYHKHRTGNWKYGYHPTYYCYSRSKKVKSMIKNPDCKNKAYRIEILDNIIFDEIKKLALDTDYIHNLKEKNHKPDNRKQIDAINAEIKNIDAQISRFMDLYGVGRYTIKELDEKVIPLKEQRDKLTNQLKEKEETENKTRLSEKEAIKIIDSFEGILENGDFAEIRAVIEKLIDHIVIDNEDITIYWNFV